MNTATFPETFSMFRKLVGDALEYANAPEDLVEEVREIDNMGGGVVQEMWNAWTIVEDNGLTPEEWSNSDELVHDMVLDMVSAWRNPMNYGHSRFVLPTVDPSKLADSVAAVLFAP